MLPAHATFISPELLFGDSLSLPASPFRLIMEIDSSPGKHRQYIRAINHISTFSAPRWFSLFIKRVSACLISFISPASISKLAKAPAPWIAAFIWANAVHISLFYRMMFWCQREGAWEREIILALIQVVVKKKKGKKPRLPMGISSVISQMAS